MSFESGKCWEVPESCKKCLYRTRVGNISICGYVFFTGKLRNCPVSECTHYERKTKKRLQELKESET